MLFDIKHFSYLYIKKFILNYKCSFASRNSFDSSFILWLDIHDPYNIPVYYIAFFNY
jgi:hypothetical protein